MPRHDNPHVTQAGGYVEVGTSARDPMTDVIYDAHHLNQPSTRLAPSRSNTRPGPVVREPDPGLSKYEKRDYRRQAMNSVVDIICKGTEVEDIIGLANDIYKFIAYGKKPSAKD